MNREAFLSEIRQRLNGLSEDALGERIAFYSEMIDRRMAEGATEEEAVAAIGPVDAVVAKILSEIPLSALMRERSARRGRLKGWQIALLVLGAPLWLPLLIAAAAVLLALFAVIWALVLCLYAVDLGLAAGAVGGLVGVAAYLRLGNPAGALFAAGDGLVCAGLAILLFFACGRVARGVAKLTGRVLTGIKTSFVGKEA